MCGHVHLFRYSLFLFSFLPPFNPLPPFLFCNPHTVPQIVRLSNKVCGFGDFWGNLATFFLDCMVGCPPSTAGPARRYTVHEALYFNPTFFFRTSNIFGSTVRGCGEGGAGSEAVFAISFSRTSHSSSIVYRTCINKKDSGVCTGGNYTTPTIFRKKKRKRGAPVIPQAAHFFPPTKYFCPILFNWVSHQKINKKNHSFVTPQPPAHQAPHLYFFLLVMAFVTARRHYPPPIVCCADCA